MRAWIIAAGLAVTLAACGGGDGEKAAESTSAEAVEGGGGCSDAVTSGEALTADDIDGCVATVITSAFRCDDGSKVVGVTLDDQTYALVEGEPGEKVSDLVALGSLCP